LMLSTPKGGMYSVTMSDGTTVWLNAESTLKYPSRFDDDARVVELEGEAFFDVAKRAPEGGSNADRQQQWPFIVVSQGQRIEVLGTQFNVSVYADQDELKTTLVEGSVRLIPSERDQTTGVVLKPGEQAVITRQTSSLD